MAAYVRLSFGDEVELTGYIGDATITAESKSRFRTMTIEGEVGGMQAKLVVTKRRFRREPVTGEVMGQPIRGHLSMKDGHLVLDGMAGQEPILYRLSRHGSTSNRGHDLGIQVVYQAFYSEIVGTVFRVPDAAMIALLLPLLLARQERAEV